MSVQLFSSNWFIFFPSTCTSIGVCLLCLTCSIKDTVNEGQVKHIALWDTVYTAKCVQNFYFGGNMWIMYLSGIKKTFSLCISFMQNICFCIYFIYTKCQLIFFLPFDFVVKCDQMWNLFYFIFRFFGMKCDQVFIILSFFFLQNVSFLYLIYAKLYFLFFPFDFVVRKVSWDFPTYITWLCFDMHVYACHFPNAFNQTSYFKTKRILVVQIGMLTNVCCTVISCIKCAYCTLTVYWRNRKSSMQLWT